MAADPPTAADRRVAVLGTGTMGAPTARNLLRAGFEAMRGAMPFMGGPHSACTSTAPAAALVRPSRHRRR